MDSGYDLTYTDARKAQGGTIAFGLGEISQLQPIDENTQQCQNYRNS